MIKLDGDYKIMRKTMDFNRLVWYGLHYNEKGECVFNRNSLGRDGELKNWEKWDGLIYIR